MKVLPAETSLPRVCLARAHTPAEAADYAKYRACCRWDFGFSCVLCFLHESDLVEGGAEGTSLVWIEHVEPQSTEKGKELINDYANCLLSCRYCNHKRSTFARKTEDGRTLLDPTDVAWGERFQVVDRRMAPRDPDDRDATYTARVYRLDDPRKAQMRESRAARCEVYRQALADFIALVPSLLEKARTSDDLGEKRLFLESARALEAAHDAAFREVARYRATPTDAPTACTCPISKPELPQWLAAQLEDVEERR
jgi:hypothetical protein